MTTIRLPSNLLRYRFREPVFVTRPTMPPLEEYRRLLAEIWERRWLTNNGSFHRELERRLAEYLGVENLSLCCNGTIALLIALEVLGIRDGEVVTTPFTFPATVHSLYWHRVEPVFCDIDPQTYNLDPGHLEALIGPRTRAVLPVHVYGTPCAVEVIQEIASRHRIAVIYDAAHAFGVHRHPRPLLLEGDASILSFHATKVFSTAEGGALIVGDRERKRQVEELKNFGITGEETVVAPGINGKMSELQAAYGLLQLDRVDDEIASRCRVAELYRQRLRSVPGITLLEDQPNVQANGSFFPICVDTLLYGHSRDDLQLCLRQLNVITRKYFFPLCSRYPCYAHLPSAAPGNLPVAERVSRQILCLPIYGTLTDHEVETICSAIEEIHRAA